MSKVILQLPTDLAANIDARYKGAQLESVIAIYLRPHQNMYLAESIDILPECAYRRQTKRVSSISGQYVKGIIEHCLKQKFAGFLLMHNHLIKIPYASLSSTDKQAHKKVDEYLEKHHPEMLYGTTVYTRGRCSIRFNRGYSNIVNRSLKKMAG